MKPLAQLELHDAPFVGDSIEFSGTLSGHKLVQRVTFHVSVAEFDQSASLHGLTIVVG
jgi:hypothetical protein